jgi:hypothetical protein
MSKVNLFLNSRGRPNDLAGCLQSMRETAGNINDCKIYFTCDEDDPQLDSYRDIPSQFPEFNLSYTIGQRPKNLHTSINNMAAAASCRGEVLMVLNDDVRFVSKDWDEELLAAKESLLWDDGIAYFRTQDNSCDKKAGWDYASFPALTKEAHKALGYFMSEKFVGLGGDVHLYRVFQKLNRIIDVPIYLDHIYHTTPDLVVNGADKTALEMRNNTWNNYIDPFTYPIDMDYHRVKECFS